MSSPYSPRTDTPLAIGGLSCHNPSTRASRTLSDLWNAAFAQYRLSLEVGAHDKTLTLFLDLDHSVTAEDVLDKLQDVSTLLNRNRQGRRGAQRLREALKPVINGLIVLLDASAETATSLVSFDVQEHPTLC